MKQTKRILSLLMVLVLCVSLAPLSAFASGEPEEIIDTEDAPDIMEPVVLEEAPAEEAEEPEAIIDPEDTPDIMEPGETEEASINEPTPEEKVSVNYPLEDVSYEEERIAQDGGTNGYTRESAVAWAKAQLGKSLDYDGAYGAQCVDLIKYYYKQLAGYAVLGNGCDYATNKLPSGWTRVYSNYQPGDIGVWKCNTSTTGANGHVAIIIAVSGTSFTAVTQNSDGHKYCIEKTYNASVLQCAIRPDFGNTPNPVAPTISGVSVSGTSVTVSWGAVANATSYDVYLVQSPWGWNDIKYSGSTTSSSYTFTNVAVGDYCAFVIARPNKNSVQSAWSSLSVADTYVATVTTEAATNVTKTNAQLNGKVSHGSKPVSYHGVYLGTSSGNYTKYTQACGHPNADPLTIWYDVTAEFGVTLSPGTTYYYKCFCITSDGKEYVGAETSFTTISDIPDTPVIQVNGDTFYEGDTVTISWAPTTNAASYNYYVAQHPAGYAYTDSTKSGNTASTSISFNDLESGRYYVFIHAISSSGGVSNQSNWLTFCVKDRSYTPVATETYNGHTYLLYDAEETWSFAEELCNSLGGHMVTVTDAAENAFITEFINKGSKDAYWLGGNNADAVEFDSASYPYKWITGEAFSYANWHSGEPSYGNSGYYKEHFLEIRKSYDYLWNDAANGNKSNKGFILEIDSASYTVTYDANGGTGAPDAQTKTHDVALTLSSTKPTRPGYTFQGWATTKTATTASYSAGGSYTNNASVTLCAVWKHNGDIDGDGFPNSTDLIVLSKYLSGATSAPKNPDVNNDGVHDLLDLVRLMKLLAK